MTPTNDAPVTVEPAAYLYESEGYGRELVFDCNGEHARRLIELGYTETPLFAHRLAALASAPALDARTAALVIAAREFWDIHNDLSDESRALDRALEPFSASVPYADQPVCSACGGNGYSGGKMPAEDKQGEYDDACEVCYGHGIASAPAAGSREAAMVTLRTDDSGRPKVWCDPEIADLIDALNTDALSTVASCSGHGHRPGIIMLTDGRCLMVFRDREYAKAAEGAYPLDINGVASAPAGDHVPDAGNMIAPAGDGYSKWHPMLLDLVNAIHRDRGEKTQAIGIDLSYQQALAAALARPRAAEPTTADMAAFGASDAACTLYPGTDQQAERAAFCEGAAHAVSSPRAAVGEREAVVAAWVAENPFPEAPYGCEDAAKYLLLQAAWYEAKADFLRSLALQSPPAKVEG